MKRKSPRNQRKHEVLVVWVRVIFIYIFILRSNGDFNHECLKIEFADILPDKYCLLFRRPAIYIDQSPYTVDIHAGNNIELGDC